MTATGTFTVKLAPQEAADVGDGMNIGRFSNEKVFSGNLIATSKGTMLTATTATEGSAGYVLIERIEGTLGGKKGSFVVQHSSTLDRNTPTQSIVVVPDSGTGELKGLRGSIVIEIAGGEHRYKFDYWQVP